MTRPPYRSAETPKASARPSRRTLRTAKRLQKNHRPNVVPESFQVIQGGVYCPGLQRDGTNNAVRQIELPGARHFEEDWNLAREMIGHADDFGFLVYQLAVGRDFKTFLGETDEGRAAQGRERLHGLAHRDRQTDQFERDVDTATIRNFAKLFDRIAGRGVDRDRVESFREFELSAD